MIDEELVFSFVTESREMLEDVEPILIEIQQIADDTGEVDSELINTVFRLFHSMKGSAGFLQFNTISKVTHEAETMLDLFRKGKASISTEHTTLLCTTIDFVREVIDSIEENLVDEGFEDEGKIVSEKLAEANAGITGKKKKTKSNAEQTKKQAPAPVKKVEEKPVAKPQIELSKEMVESFIQEADEQLDVAEARLSEIQDADEVDEELLAETYRSIHSFKGNCGFMGYGDLEGLSHKAENVLDLIRSGRLEFDEECSSILLKIIDVLADGIADISKGGKGKVQGWQVMGELLDEVAAEASPAEDNAEENEAPTSVNSLVDNNESQDTVKDVSCDDDNNLPKIAVVDDEEQVRELIKTALSDTYNIHLFSDPEEALASIKGKSKEYSLIISDIKMPKIDGYEFIKMFRKTDSVTPVMVVTGYGDKDLLVKLMELGVDEFLDKPFDVATLKTKVTSAIAKGNNRRKADSKKKVKEISSGSKRKSVARKDIRVDLEKLDMLINLVGELVIAESMVTNNPDIKGQELENFDRAAHHLRRITMDLQDISMSVRMVPLAGTFKKMVRLVHELSVKVGKKVKLELKGEDTEVDKTVIEQIADPLVHIVRNSVDHGQEETDERLAVGKSEIGLVSIEARHEGGEVWILIKDDGRGLDKDKLLARAIDRGVIDKDADLSDDEIYRLIFEPGFSTAEKVSDVSGRGVGMDVVKRNIEKLKGKVDIKTELGVGTTIILRIPLTLAIIEGMLIRIANDKYTIPLLSIKESFRPQKHQITKTMDGQEVVRLRDELVPVIRLHEFFNKKPEFTRLEDGILVVIEDDGDYYAMFVDEIIGQQQTVIKGLSEYIGRARGVSGCTIMGDGTISLIIDIGSLIDMAHQDGQLDKNIDYSLTVEDSKVITEKEVVEV